VLLRIVSNILQMRTLQRDGALPLAPARVFDLRECVRRCVRMVQALDCVPSRLMWIDEFTPEPPLPERVLGDEGALTACLHNMLITCACVRAAFAPMCPCIFPARLTPVLRMRNACAAMLWLPPGAPLQLHIGAYAEGEEHEASARPGVQLSVTARTRKEELPPRSDASESPRVFTLHANVETPGRPLTAAEVEAALAPFSMLPADKGGGTGLGLFGASHTAIRPATSAKRR
jgi:hypothetical protein